MTTHEHTALVVDDDASIRLILCEALKNAGYATNSAENGEMALHKYIESFHDIIVTDYDMPGMNGIQLIDHLKRVEYNLPVLVTTGMSNPRILEQLLKFPNLLILPKPFDEKILLQAVEKVMAGRTERNLASRRKQVRIPISTTASTNSHGSVEVRNICLSGLGAHSQAKIPTGTGLTVALETDSCPLTLKAKTVWSHNHECGMMFTEITAEESAALKQWLYFKLLKLDPCAGL